MDLFDILYNLSEVKRNFFSNLIFKKNYNDLEIDEKAYFISRKYREAINLFVKRMGEVKPWFYFESLEKNINTLKIRDKLYIKDALGTYNCFENIINILLKDGFSTIYHELMHMASFRLPIDGICRIGFRQLKLLSFNIGGGLNEGYTELLTERYFFDQGIVYSYGCLTGLTKDIENIVGKDKMEYLYFNADLYNLKEDIIKDCSEDEFMQFISDSDWFLNKGKNYDSDELIERCQRMGNFVYLTYLKRQIRLFLADEVSADEYDSRVNETLEKIDSLYFDLDGKVFWKCNKKKMKEELLELDIDVPDFLEDIPDKKIMVKKN